MKTIVSLFIVFAILCGCETVMPLSHAEESSLIWIECKNETTVRLTVTQLLRSIRAKDIEVGEDGFVTNIQAAFGNTDFPRGKLEEIKDKLEEMNGVLHVEIRENHSIIRQSF
jgi:hypothetical protein